MSRSEFDPKGSLEIKTIKQVFVRFACLMEVHVDGKAIKTTLEHPFYVRKKGWTKAIELERGDWLMSHDENWTMVERKVELNEYATVYNLHVEDCHTYFVGRPEWSCSVWAHNTEDYVTGPGGGRKHESRGRGSEHSGAEQNRQKAKQDKRVNKRLKEKEAGEKALEELKALENENPAAYRLRFRNQQEIDQWLRNRQLELMGGR